MLLGAHVSIAGGLHNAFSRGEEIGCTAIQIFTKNQNRWSAKPLTDAETAQFKQTWQNSTISAVVAHDSYLINLGNPDQDGLQQSRQAFLVEMDRAEKLGIPYLVFHPGSHKNAGESFGLKKIAESINILLEQRKDYQLCLLLETTAGQGTNLGYTFEQLAQIIELVNNPQRVGVCLDTAHIFAAGYDIRTEQTYQKTINTFDQILGLSTLCAIHLNDSKKELGSRIDRHEHIGKGLIGLDAFRFILHDERFQDIPKILETPGKEEDFKRNLDVLKSLI
ncbi:deoxyribonuclease IV [candidate division KSB1 bacterium]|nr:deoxyribonuclease IV [bacterium]OQX58146.1 MAG: deoxyribonuclease IV [candidate division KSB1 bacterium 4484_219]RKY83562.1 MAG: deoxyribonuclease IV [candidate division KSB1 bacterium]